MMENIISMEELDAQLKDKEWVTQEAALCRNDLKYLCRDTLGMNDWDECHDRLLEWKYQNRDRRFKMYLMPRGFLKTSVLTIGETIQDILNDFDTRILLTSAVWNNARSFLREIADQNMGYLTQKSNLPNIFGEFRTDTWNAEKVVVAQRQKPNKTPTIDTAGIDKVLTSQHYRIIKADDLVTRETTTTAEQIEKVKNHLKDLLKLLDPDGLMDIVGTRWDDQDAYRWVLDELTREDQLRDEAFAVFDLPPVRDESGKKVYLLGSKYPDGSIPTFPKKFTIPILENLKYKLGSYDFSCNIENNPTSPTNRIFNEPMRYWDSLPEEVAHMILVDPAISANKGTCDAVVVDTAESRGGQIFVVDYETFQGEKKHPGRIIDKIIEYHLVHGTPVCGIEAVGYQEVLCMLLKDELKKRKLVMEVVAIHQNEDKARRIICLQPYWERNDLLIKRGMAQLEDQLLKFRKPIVAAVDILDAIAMKFQIPDEHKIFKAVRMKTWAHPHHQLNPQHKNPYEGRALPEKEWNKLQARRGFHR